MPNGTNGPEDPETTLGDVLNLRFETGAERPSFFTEDQIDILLPAAAPPPDALDVELGRQAANRRFASQLTREALDSLGPNFCGIFPEAAVCAAGGSRPGETRIPRPGGRAPGPETEVEIAPGRRVTRPRGAQEQDVFEALQARFADEALLREREARTAAQEQATQERERLATRRRELKQQAEEEEFFQLTPSERLRRGLRIAPLGGLSPIFRATAGR